MNFTPDYQEIWIASKDGKSKFKDGALIVHRLFGVTCRYLSEQRPSSRNEIELYPALTHLPTGTLVCRHLRSVRAGRLVAMALMGLPLPWESADIEDFSVHELPKQVFPWYQALAAHS